MTTWSEFAAAQPDLAEKVRASFDRQKHKTMATLRKDGSPRISGTEVEFADGEMRIGSMPRALKAQDLLRDPRIAIHGPGVDPAEDNSEWAGEAKVAGRAYEITDPAVLDEVLKDAPSRDSHLFRVDLDEVVMTGLGGDPPDHLVIDIWTAGGGRRQVKRA